MKREWKRTLPLYIDHRTWGRTRISVWSLKALACSFLVFKTHGPPANIGGILHGNACNARGRILHVIPIFGHVPIIFHIRTQITSFSKHTDKSRYRGLYGWLRSDLLTSPYTIYCAGEGEKNAKKCAGRKKTLIKPHHLARKFQFIWTTWRCRIYFSSVPHGISSTTMHESPPHHFLHISLKPTNGAKRSLQWHFKYCVKRNFSSHTFALYYSILCSKRWTPHF